MSIARSDSEAIAGFFEAFTVRYSWEAGGRANGATNADWRSPESILPTVRLVNPIAHRGSSPRAIQIKKRPGISAWKNGPRAAGTTLATWLEPTARRARLQRSFGGDGHAKGAVPIPAKRKG